MKRESYNEVLQMVILEYFRKEAFFFCCTTPERMQESIIAFWLMSASESLLDGCGLLGIHKRDFGTFALKSAISASKGLALFVAQV